MKKLASMLTLAVILLGFLAAIPIRPAFAATTLKVEPNLVEKYNNVDNVGDTFGVSIIAEDVTGLFGWEFNLEWTPGVINCVGETLNLGIWGTGNFLGPWVPVPINNAAGEYHQSVTGKAPGTPFTGTVWLVNLTFEIVADAPFTPPQYIDTDLHLKKSTGYIAYCLLDSLSQEIPHAFADGYYIYHYVPPTEFPHLEVVPAMNTFAGKNIYKVPFSFSVDVEIKDVLGAWGLVGVEFLLFYNTTILDVLSVTQGDFFTPFATFEFFSGTAYESFGYIRVAYVQVSPIPPSPNPYGSGTIATIVFNATYQEQFPTTVWSDLDIEVDTPNGMTSYFINWVANDIPYDPEVDGYYSLAGYVVGRVVDLYVCNYPDPYGGQGPMQPSDMFWPQKEICLCANVTYNEWPVQNKLVAFEIRDPSGALIDILTAMSDEYGVATACFRIPWPCDDPESLFGVWTVIATVDIACIVVNDTMQFHFDYLVHWLDVSTDKDEYGHCENIKITVAFGSHSMQNRTVLLAVSVHDELNYPFGVAYMEVYVGGATFCTLKEYEYELEVHVVKWAAAGLATVLVNAYSDWPTMGGSPWAPTYAPPPEVSILAIWA